MSANESATVKFLDLKAEFEPIRQEILGAIHEVIESQQFILGPKVAELEERVAAYCANLGTPYLIRSRFALAARLLGRRRTRGPPRCVM